MKHKAMWKGHRIRLEVIRLGLLVELVNHYTTKGVFEAITIYIFKLQ